MLVRYLRRFLLLWDITQIQFCEKRIEWRLQSQSEIN